VGEGGPETAPAAREDFPGSPPAGGGGNFQPPKARTRAFIPIPQPKSIGAQAPAGNADPQVAGPAALTQPTAAEGRASKRQGKAGPGTPGAPSPGRTVRAAISPQVVLGRKQAVSGALGDRGARSNSPPYSHRTGPLDLFSRGGLRGGTERRPEPETRWRTTQVALKAGFRVDTPKPAAQKPIRLVSEPHGHSP